MLVSADLLVGAVLFVVLTTLSPLGGLSPDEALARPSWLALAALSALSWPLAFSQLGLYGSQRVVRLSHVLGRLLLAGAVCTGALVALTSALQAPVSAQLALLVGGAQCAALTVLRTTILVGLRLVRRLGRNYRNTVIVGTGPRACEVRRTIELHPEWGLRVIGFVDEAGAPTDPRIRPELVHKLQDVPTLLRDQVVDEVILACPRSMLQVLTPVIAVCAAAGTPVTMLTDIFGDYLPPPRISRFGSLAALSFAPVHHSRTRQLAKRGIDLVAASSGLLLAGPVLGLAALAIRTTSPGPVLFRQIRCGLNGRTFEILKLRTMTVDAERKRAELQHLNEMDGPVFKLQQDPRITPVGRILRRYSLDELPQLWNVLRGEMSLVGPRPAVPHEVAQYETAERRRLSMRPGLTCLWQVSGRNTIGFDEWVRMDLQYIDEWTLLGDLKILLRTIPAVLLGTGR